MSTRLKKVRRALAGVNRLASDAQWFNESHQVLDIGCGKGEFLKKCPVRCVGVDGSPQNVALCNGLGLETYQALLPSRLPFEDEAFDGIYCSHLVEHFLPGEAREILNEADRLLMPGGILLVRSPLFRKGFFDDPTHVRPYHLQSVLHMLGGWEESGTRQSIMGAERRRYDLLSYYEETYPLYVSDVSPTIAPRRFPVRLGLRAMALGMARMGVGMSGAYGAVLRKRTAA